MTAFIESLVRLYQSHLISREKVVALFASKRITKEEMDYILRSI